MTGPGMTGPGMTGPGKGSKAKAGIELRSAIPEMDASPLCQGPPGWPND